MENKYNLFDLMFTLYREGNVEEFKEICRGLGIIEFKIDGVNVLSE